jgi:site-specific DNA-cytosine methylase
VDTCESLIPEVLPFDRAQITSQPHVAIAFPEFLSGTQCAAAENLSPTLQSVNPTAVAFNLRGREGGAMPEADPDNLACQLAASGGSSRSYVAFSARARGDDGRGYDRPPQVFGDVVGSLDKMKPHHVAQGYAVRRLTPTECERLQGFPDDYTRIPTWNGWRAMADDESPEQCREQGLEVRQNKKTGKWRVKDVDGPRYKALGNSMAVPVMRWIGGRIATHLNPKN